jgi:glutamate racemase
MMSLRVGICDSGIGGLSVLKELYNAIPAEYIYIGDSLRAPYGNKTREELLQYTQELLTFLQSHKVDVYVSACNSISTLDTRKLLNTLGIKKSDYIDMCDFAECAKGNIPSDAKMLVYGTVATIESNVYQEVFKEWSTCVLASKQLAYAIETQHQIAIDEEVDTLLDYVIQEGVTHIFLACTHYPLIQDYLDIRFKGMGVTFINPAQHIPNVLHPQKKGRHSLTMFTTKTSEPMREYVSGIDDVVPVVIEL